MGDKSLHAITEEIEDRRVMIAKQLAGLHLLMSFSRTQITESRELIERSRQLIERAQVQLKDR